MNPRRNQRQGLLPCLRFFLAVAACLSSVLALPGSPALAASVWREYPSPTLALLNAVKFANRAQGWAVGDRGAVVRYAKGTWENFPSGTDADLHSIAVLGNGEAWAVGHNGTIVHFDGTRWAAHPQSGTLTLLPLRAVKFLTPSIGWAVGGRPCQAGVALRYNGAAWVSATQTSDPLYGVEVLSDDNVWFCGGNRRIMRFDGAGFAALTCTPSDGKAWYGIAFPFRSVGWVVGDGGLVWRFSSGSMCFAADAASSAVTTNSLRAISMLPGSTAGMAVGDGGVRLRYNGAGFELDALGGEDLRGIDLTSDLEGQAVGGTKAAPTTIRWGAVPGSCATYPNETCEQMGALGPFTETFSGPGPIYFAIRARIGGVDYCSPEYRIAVNAGGPMDPWDTGDDLPGGATDLVLTEAEQTHGTHKLSFSDPVDWYRFQMTKGCPVTLVSTYTLGVATAGGAGDVIGELYSDASGLPAALVASNDNGAVNQQFSITYSPPANGYYWLKVTTAAAGETWTGNIRYFQAVCGRPNIVVTSWPPDMAGGGSVTVAWDLAGWPSAGRIAAFRAVTTETDLSRFRVYPNPVDPGRGETLSLDRLPRDVDRVDIYTVRGELVGSLGAGVAYDPVTGIAVWSCRIGSGRAAATGNYILRMHTKSGGTGRAIIMVVKK